jgi:hypothetical protein
MNVWSLPGPARFLGDAIEAVRDGLNVVAARPRTQPRDLAVALEDALGAASFHVERIARDDGRLPLNLLYDQLVEGEREGVRRSVGGLCQALRPGLVVLVPDVRESAWDGWRRLLLEFEHVTRSMSAFDRPLLLLELVGVDPDGHLAAAPAVRTFTWRGVVSELDMNVFVEDLFRGRRPPHGRILLRTIGRLAGWDFELAELLSQESPASVYAPVPLLSGLYRRGVLEAPPQASWEAGGHQLVDGMPARHPALLALDGDPAGELAMRVWAAHAAEVLPMVEIARRDIVDRVRARVTPPIVVGEETFADLDDLEIGQLSHLACTRRLPHGFRSELLAWKEVRNSLAHLQPLTVGEVDDVMGLLARGRAR